MKPLVTSARQVGHARLRRTDDATKVGRVARKALSILLADDDENLRVLITCWLQAAGHSVQSAGTAKEAALLFGTRKFDLVVTDILMPDGDGLELISHVKAGQPAPRILAISGGGKYVEGDNCLKLARGWGAHAAVIKPFNREQLLAAVDLAFAPPVWCY